MYGTLIDANTYFATKTFDEDSKWANAADDVKNRALERAAILIDRLDFSGDKTASGQVHEFPRDEATTVPTEIEYAAYESARALVIGVDPEKEFQLRGASSLGMNRVNVDKEPGHISEARLHGIPSMLAWDLLKPFLNEGDTFSIERI